MNMHKHTQITKVCEAAGMGDSFSLDRSPTEAPMFTIKQDVTISLNKHNL